jgi:hypothetical protein
MMETTAPVQEGIKVHGSFRLRIRNPDGEIVGDSGWHDNLVTNLGFNNYLCQLLGGMAGSQVITHVALGSGTAPGAADTSLAGEVEVRKAITAATSSTSKKLQITATFASGDNFVTNTQNISNIGLFYTSEKGVGSIFAGSDYASSSCAVNQNVEITYDIDFA